MAMILIATADSALATLLLAELGGEGHAITWALDGHEALELALGQSPDLILMDQTLEWVSTQQVCETLRNRTDIPPDLPILLLSDEFADARTLARLQVTERLGKSHTVAELRELLARLLAP